MNSVFVCPFNGYHKLFDYRKLQFHVAKCKDRRGKALYHCKYTHSHIHTSVDALLAHEAIC